MSDPSRGNLGLPTWRAAAVVFLVVLLGGLGIKGAAALWGQHAQASLAVAVGTWDAVDSCGEPTTEQTLPGTFRTVNWNGVDGYFTLLAEWWRGELIDSVEFCQDGVSLGHVQLQPGAVSASYAVDGLPNGTYEFTYLVRTPRGEVMAGPPLHITVTEALPSAPTLRYESWHKVLYANRYNGTAATGYRVLIDGVETDSGHFGDAPSNQELRVALDGLAPGHHVIVVEYLNRYGASASSIGVDIP